MTIVVASTIPAYVMDQPDTYAAWLRTQDEMRRLTPTDVRYFAALEYDGRGPDIFAPIVGRLDDCWTFRFDDGATDVRTNNRLRRITMGQNLCSAYAMDVRASHMLFMAADCEPPGDAIVKLLELDWPIVGGEVTTYCLSGPWVTHHPASKLAFDFPVQSHMATAAFVMLNRDLLRRLHWRYDTEMEMTDDPCLHADALQLGFPTLVRKDCIGHHFPEAIPPIELRGHDMHIYNEEEPAKLKTRELETVIEPLELSMVSAFEAKRYLMSVALANRGCQAVACVDQDAGTVEALFRATSDPKIAFTAAGQDRAEIDRTAAKVPIACTVGGPVIWGPAAVVVMDDPAFPPPDWDAYAAAGARCLVVNHYKDALVVESEDYWTIAVARTPEGKVVLYDKLPQPMPAAPAIFDNVEPIRATPIVKASGNVVFNEDDDYPF